MITPADIDAICFMGFFASSAIALPAAYAINNIRRNRLRKTGAIVECKVIAKLEDVGEVEVFECYSDHSYWVCCYEDLILSYEYDGRSFEHIESGAKRFDSKKKAKKFMKNMSFYKYQVTFESDEPSDILSVDIISKESEVKINADKLRKD